MGTIRDPQTDISTANHAIGGDWTFDTILTYTSPLGFTNPTDIVDKQYVDSQVIGGANEDNIYYIGKHGNDIVNGGRNVGAAFLTIQKGIDTADARLPTISNQYVVRINDGGTYSVFSMTSKPYINIEAAGANLATTGINPFEIGGNNSIVANSMTRNTIAGVIVEKTGGGNGYLKVNNIYGSVNTISAIQVTSGTLYAEVDSIIMPTTSSAINISDRIELKSKRIDGMIVFSASGVSANIITHDLNGNIILSTNCTLNIIILGKFTGNITAPAGCKIKMLVAERTAGYNDAYYPTSEVDIEYLGVHDDPRNLLIGGDYSVNPRQEKPIGILAAVDGSYVADNTILVNDNGAVIKVESSLFSSQRDLALTTLVANNQFGIVIPIENKDSLALLSSEKASMSSRAKWSSSPTRTLKMALIAWTGPREAITRDVVSTWQSGALNPILAANWIYENSPSTLSFNAADTFDTFKIENIDVTTSSAENFAVFIWVNSATIGLGETLSISNVRCTSSEFVGAFHPRSAAEEISLCQRYYVQSSPAVAGTPATYFGAYTVFKGAGGNTSSFIGMNIIFPTSMTKIPILTPRSPHSGAVGYVRNESSSSDLAAIGSRISQYAGSIELAAPYSSDSIFSVQWVADGKL